MTKTHVVNLHIVNNLPYDLTFAHEYFRFGGLADGQSWPTTIAANGGTADVECCESSGSLLGCSGWVQYTPPSSIGGNAYFCFSNLAAGQNGIDIGGTTSVYDAMTSQYDFPATRAFLLNGPIWMTGSIQSTSGDHNQANYTVNALNLSVITEANIQMTDVMAVFNNIPVTPSYRKYYECGDSPTTAAGLLTSHFKGISVYGDKVILSHTNLGLLLPNANGKMIVADLRSGPTQAKTEGTFDTFHPGWAHPCSSQACGSFMAQGIQKNADGAMPSKIEILDIRNTAVNQRPTLLGVIDRPEDGINGVGMTKMAGPDGKYLVAAVNGNKLRIYKSRTSSLIGNGSPQFDQVLAIDDFAESGAGLGLLTQTDGSIFLLTMNADDDGSNSEVCLYQYLDGATPALSERLARLELPVTDTSGSVATAERDKYLILPVPVLGPVLFAMLTIGKNFLNSSFRWGKGIAITSASTIELYASDRNDLSLSSIPAVGSKQDFSVLVWASTPPPACR